MRLSITIEDGLYGKVKRSAEDNERTVNQEILHRIKRFSPDPIVGEFTLPSSNPINSLPISTGANPMYGKDDYSEIISFIEKISDEGYQGTPDDVASLGVLEKEYGVKWNAFKGVLEKRTEDGVIVVWKK